MTGAGKLPGTLFVVATPIGNLEDITLRAVRTLKEADLIACEDTRQALKLLNRFEIRKELIGFFEPRERERLPRLLDRLRQGQSVALISDAGTPAISDPGFRLVREAIKEGIRVVPIPGPSAVSAALSAAGLPTHRFLFLGFPPPKKEGARKKLLSVRQEEGTLIFYLPGRKLSAFIGLVKETLGRRMMVVAREMTKIHEEFVRGDPEEILKYFENKQVKGEICLLVHGSKK
jgi:16S rRNA (cytidine1402-2'-O)-methyltransferase